MVTKISILIADNSKDFANLLKTKLSLENSFFIVGIVQNGAQVIEMLNDDKIDLILLDIILPVVNGLEILTHINSMKLRTKAIVISALSAEKIISEALANGAQYYLCKPFSIDNFITKIKSIVFG